MRGHGGSRRVRAGLAFLAGTVLASPPVAGQVEIVDGRGSTGTVARAFRLDFAVPDGPAFKLLEVDPSAILRPSSVRELSLAASEFTSDAAFTIPNSFGAELSPGLLIAGPRLSLADYDADAWLYRIRVSAATRREHDVDRPTAVAFGIRASIIDDADLRANFGRVQQAILDTINAVHALAARRRGNPALTGANIVLTPDEIREVERLNERLKDEWADSLWNASAFDVAFAVRASGKDSLASDLKADEWAFWGTYGLGIGDWGQLLLGAKGGAARDTLSGDFGASGALSARFYYGSNRYKGFTELQGRWMADASPAWLLNFGAEASILGEVWLGLSTGLELDRTTGDTGLQADFSLKIGIL